MITADVQFDKWRWSGRTDQIPQIYACADFEKLPDRATSERFVGPDSGCESGQIFTGPTESGKTMTAALMAINFVRDSFDDDFDPYAAVKFIRGKTFKKEVIRRTKPADDDAEPLDLDEWLDPLIEAKFLIIDELDKITFSPRVKIEFFELLEARVSQGHWLTTVITCTSYDALTDAIKGRDGDDDEDGTSVADQIIRRLNEFFEIVRFNPNKGTT